MFRTAIFDALKAKFVGVSDAILNRIADKLDKTVTKQEDVATAVAGVTIQQVIESYGDSRATEAQQTAVRNYEQKYGLKDGVRIEGNGGTPSVPPVTPPVTPPAGAAPAANGGNDDAPAWAKKLIDRLDAIEGSARVSARKQKLATVIDKLPESLRKAYERTPLDSLSDEEFNTLITDVTAEVGDIVKDTNARGAVFGKPSAQNATPAPNELSAEQKSAIEKRDTPAADGQPF